MSTIEYHSVDPTNNRPTYTELDVVTFDINNLGRKLRLGSLRLEGTFNATNVVSDTNNGTNRDIKMDSRAGVHSFIDSISVSTASGMIENIPHSYARSIAMADTCTLDYSDYFSSDKVCELRSSNDALSIELLTQSKSGGDTPLTYDRDFSIKPSICLNKPIQGNVMSFGKYGNIQIQLSIARALNVFYGVDVAANSPVYSISGLRLTYTTVPEDNKNPPLLLRSMIPIKSSINSNHSNTSLAVPGVCDAVSVSFVRINSADTQADKSTQLMMPPGWESIQFIYQNSSSNYVSYTVDSLNEVQEFAIQSYQNTGHNQFYGMGNASDDRFVCGLPFNCLIDLSAQKFNIQLNAPGISSIGPHFIICIFHSLVKLK